MWIQLECRSTIIIARTFGGSGRTGGDSCETSVFLDASVGGPWR